MFWWLPLRELVGCFLLVYSFTLVVSQPTRTQYLISMLFEQLRGTRGSTSAVSGGEDLTVLGEFIHATFQFAEWDMRVAW